MQRATIFGAMANLLTPDLLIKFSVQNGLMSMSPCWG